MGHLQASQGHSRVVNLRMLQSVIEQFDILTVVLILVPLTIFDVMLVIIPYV